MQLRRHGKCLHVPRSNALSEIFERYRRSLAQADLESFEALCFHHAETVAAPYSRLLNAPRIQDHAVARALVERAYENSAQAIHEAYATDKECGAKIFAYALASLCEGPGCIPSLISVYGPDRDGKADSFECNIQHERGGAINSNFTATYGGLTCDSYYYYEEPFGKDSSVTFSTDHLTDEGVEFAKWLFSERIEALRRRG
jgi:hypothetical protein